MIGSPTHADRRSRYLIVAAGALLGLGVPAAVPSIADAAGSGRAEEAAVRNVLQRYIETARAADEKGARALFLPNALMSGAQAGGTVRAGTPEGYFVELGKLAAGPRTTYGPASVTQVTVVGDIATGTVVESDFGGRRYTDMFQLIRQDGRWLIVSKLWYGTPVANKAIR